MLGIRKIKWVGVIKKIIQTPFLFPKIQAGHGKEDARIIPIHDLIPFVHFCTLDVEKTGIVTNKCTPYSFSSVEPNNTGGASCLIKPNTTAAVFVVMCSSR